MTTDIAIEHSRSARRSRARRAPVQPARRRRNPAGLRERVAAAFRKAGAAIGGKQAFERTKDWCRATGGRWARSLD